MKFDKDIFIRTVGKRREDLNLSLRDAAKKSGVSFTTISRIENGSIPDIKTFVKLCQWLQVKPQSFFK